MTCDELRPMIESYLAGELPVDTAHEIIAHLETCPACASELEARRALQGMLRTAIRTSPALAPGEAFLAATRQALREQAEKSGRRRRGAAGWPRWLALAASLILVAGLIGWWASGPVVPQPLQALVAYAVGDHRNCALHFALEEKPIPLAQAAAQYDAMYGGLREAVAAGADPAAVEILDAHACVYRGRRFGHVVMRENGHVVSVLVTPETLRGLEGASAVEPCRGDGGLTVACFGTPRYAAFVVSDLPQDETLAFARKIQPALAKYLRG